VSLNALANKAACLTRADHLIGSPLALASRQYAVKAWVKFEDVPALQDPSIRVMHGSIEAVDCEAHNATVSLHDSRDKQTLAYDYFIAATGLRRPWPVVPQSLTRETYLAETASNIESCQDSVIVIGGGAVGVEMAAELKLVRPATEVTLIHSRQQLLSAEPLPDNFKDAVAPLVREAGVELVLGQRVADVTPDESGLKQIVKLADGSTLEAVHVLKAISHSTPTTTYLQAAVLDEGGYVKIKPTLRFTGTEHHFAIGDIARWSGIKRCGGAMHMGHHAAHNIYQEIFTRTLSAAGDAGEYHRKPDYLELNEFPPVIGLAVGKKAISYVAEQGVKQGEEVLQMMFGDDLGWSICWNYMKLGEKNLAVGEDGIEQDLGLRELELGGEDAREILEGMDGKGAERVAVSEVVAAVA
jgi:NADH dehydrogenase FAD-containing subunit